MTTPIPHDIPSRFGPATEATIVLPTPPPVEASPSDVPPRDATSSDTASGPGDSDFPPRPKTTRFHTLDSVRGIACLMLVLYHAAFYAEYSWSSLDSSTWTVGGFAISMISRLWIGVPMFFVVSGYCIAASVDSLRRRPHSLSHYFYRRFRRIYPPLWAGFAFVIAITVLVQIYQPIIAERCLQLPKLSQFSLADWVGNFAAATSWLPKVWGEEGNYLLRNTWTLCYEEQFYVVTGLILFCSTRRFFGIAYGLAVATIVARHVTRSAGISTNGFFFDGHWLMFAAGILLYQQSNYLTGLRKWLVTFLFAILAIYGAGERLFAGSPHDRHMGEYIFIAAGFAILLAAIKPWDKQIASHWILAPFRWCGKISYSIYLTHFPITILVACGLAMLGFRTDGQVFLITIPICLAISLPTSLAFYHLVERRYANQPSS